MFFFLESESFAELGSPLERFLWLLLFGSGAVRFPSFTSTSFAWLLDLRFDLPTPLNFPEKSHRL
jgi:hypothetical protein